MRPKSIGLIVNPKAGLGAAFNLNVARRVAEILNPELVITGPGLLGAEAIPSARVLPIPELTGRAASQAVARAALDASVEALVAIGGDGTLSDIAFAIYQTGSRCPILGIGAGSVNAGDLITCKASQVEALDGCEFRVESIHALEASYNDRVLALAFNDVVIGTTIVGTIEGQFQDLDANAFMQGKPIPGEPRPIGSDTAIVTKHNQAGELVVSTGQSVGTVVVGFAHYEGFFGKAIIGGVVLSSLVGAAGGCLVCDQALVRARLDVQEHQIMVTIHSAYVSLLDDDTIRVTGLDYPAVLCADGNPLAALRPTDISQMRVRRKAVDVLRIIAQNDRKQS